MGKEVKESKLIRLYKKLHWNLHLMRFQKQSSPEEAQRWLNSPIHHDEVRPIGFLEEAATPIIEGRTKIINRSLFNDDAIIDKTAWEIADALTEYSKLYKLKYDTIHDIVFMRIMDLLYTDISKGE